MKFCSRYDKQNNIWDSSLNRKMTRWKTWLFICYAFHSQTGHFQMSKFMAHKCLLEWIHVLRIFAFRKLNCDHQFYSNYKGFAAYKTLERLWIAEICTEFNLSNFWKISNYSFVDSAILWKLWVRPHSISRLLGFWEFCHSKSSKFYASKQRQADQI